MGQKVAGTVYIKADGFAFDVQGAFEAPLMKYKRETIRPGYFKEEDLPAYIKADLTFTKNFPIKKLQTAINMVITAETKGGQIYVLQGAYVIGEPAVSGDDGKVSIEFNGDDGNWQ